MSSSDRYYLDSNVIIAIVQEPQTLDTARFEFVAKIDAGQLEAVTSELALAECLTKPFGEQDQATADAFLKFLVDRPELPLLPVSPDILLSAARLRTKSRMKLPDAIHVATAQLAGCSVFLTSDKRVRLPDGLRFGIWQDGSFLREG